MDRIKGTGRIAPHLPTDGPAQIFRKFFTEFTAQKFVPEVTFPPTAMPFPVPPFRAQMPSEPPAMVRTVGREDAMWDRPVFKAPPLELPPRLLDARKLAEDLWQVSFNAR